MPVRLWAHSVIIRGISGTSSVVQDMGQAVDRDRLQAGIAEDHLVQRLAGRIAVVGRLHVQGQHLAQVGQLLEEGHRLGLAQGLEIAGLLRIALPLLDRLVAAAPGRSARSAVSCSRSIRSPT